jgi:hypothetical protein
MIRLPSIDCFFLNDKIHSDHSQSNSKQLQKIHINSDEQNPSYYQLSIFGSPSFSQTFQNQLFSSNIRPSSISPDFRYHDDNYSFETNQQKQFIELLKWISKTFPLTIHHFFDSN